MLYLLFVWVAEIQERNSDSLCNLNTILDSLSLTRREENLTNKSDIGINIFQIDVKGIYANSQLHTNITLVTRNVYIVRN